MPKKYDNLIFLTDLADKKVEEIGMKAHRLGTLLRTHKKEISIPDAFVFPATLFRELTKEAKIDKKIKRLTLDAEIDSDQNLILSRAATIRKNIKALKFSSKLEKEIISAWKKIGKSTLAVRSSATVEDLDSDSFAGQYSTVLGVTSQAALFTAIKECLASAFSDTAVLYRHERGYDHRTISMAVLVQSLVDSSKSVSGVLVSEEPESGFEGVMLLSASYGLGEAIVQGKVVPDRFLLAKEQIKLGYNAIIGRTLGEKREMIVRTDRGSGIKKVSVPAAKRKKFCIDDSDIIKLAKWAISIENSVGEAQDIEWVKDSKTGELFVTQVRPITGKRIERQHPTISEYSLNKEGQVRVTGTAIGHQISSGTIRIVNTERDKQSVKQGDIIVTRATTPAWESVMRKAGAIITEVGGKTSHAAILSREIGIPCVVGVEDARKKFKNGQRVTVSCTNGEEGKVYKGLLPFEVKHTELSSLPKTKSQILMNIADPNNAFSLSHVLLGGVGLARAEYIIEHSLGIHPLACASPKSVKPTTDLTKIKKLAVGYKNLRQYSVEHIASGLARIAASANGKPVMFRFSDLTSSEYHELLGGKEFEKLEKKALPGAGHHFTTWYKKGFEIECEAVKMVRNKWGLKNVSVMIPFCRTPEEAADVTKMMKELGLERAKDELSIFVSYSLPANVTLANEFSDLCDGFALDIDSLVEASLGLDPKVKEDKDVLVGGSGIAKQMVKDVLSVAKKLDKKVHVYGQSPSEAPEFVDFLVGQGVKSISLNPDILVETAKRVSYIEKTVGKTGHKTNKAYLSIVSFVGLLSASLIGVGAGCTSTFKPPTTIEAPAYISPARIREELQEQVRIDAEKKEMEAESAREAIILPKVHLKPAQGWAVEYTDTKISVFDPNNGDHLSIVRSAGDLIHKVGSADSDRVLVDGYSGIRFNKTTFVDTLDAKGTGTMIEVVIKPDYYVTIYGEGELFDAVLESVDFQIEVPPLIGDGQELCIQVISYARESESAECKEFPTPCDVPEGWESCQPVDKNLDAPQ